MRCQKIAATEIDHGAMPRLAIVIAIGFDHAHVFALHVLADVRPDHPQEHNPAIRGKTCPCDIARRWLRFAIKKPTKSQKSLSLQIDENRYSPLTTSITYDASPSPKCQTWASPSSALPPAFRDSLRRLPRRNVQGRLPRRSGHARARRR